MSELAPVIPIELKQRRLTPEMRAHLIQRCTDMAVDITLRQERLLEDTVQLELTRREHDRLRQRLGDG